MFFFKKKRVPKDHTVVAGRQRHAHSEKLRYHLLSSWRWIWLYPTGSDREGAAFPFPCPRSHDVAFGSQKDFKKADKRNSTSLITFEDFKIFGLSFR